MIDCANFVLTIQYKATCEKDTSAFTVVMILKNVLSLGCVDHSRRHPVFDQLNVNLIRTFVYFLDHGSLPLDILRPLLKETENQIKTGVLAVYNDDNVTEFKHEKMDEMIQQRLSFRRTFSFKTEYRYLLEQQ